MGGGGGRVGGARGVGGRRALLGRRGSETAAGPLPCGGGREGRRARRCRSPVGRDRGVGPGRRVVAGRRTRARGMVSRSPGSRGQPPLGRGGGRMGRGGRLAPRGALPRGRRGGGGTVGGGGPRLGTARGVFVGDPRLAARRPARRGPALRDAPRPRG